MEEDGTVESEVLRPILDGVNVTDSICPSWNSEDYVFVQSFRFWISVILDLPLSFIGIIVNVFCLTVLIWKQKLREGLFNQVPIPPLFFMANAPKS